jgi:hypothetical protein
VARITCLIRSTGHDLPEIGGKDVFGEVAIVAALEELPRARPGRLTLADFREPV